MKFFKIFYTDWKHSTQVINQHQGNDVIIAVYNMLQRTHRILKIHVPIGTKNLEELLGVDLRYEPYKDASYNVFQVLKIMPNSLAANAGFNQENDYIIGSLEYRFDTADDFYESLSNLRNDTSITLILFNNLTKNTRTITLHGVQMEKSGYKLGCELGYGANYQIPVLKSVDKEQNHLINSLESEDERDLTNQQAIIDDVNEDQEQMLSKSEVLESKQIENENIDRKCEIKTEITQIPTQNDEKIDRINEIVKKTHLQKTSIRVIPKFQDLDKTLHELKKSNKTIEIDYIKTPNQVHKIKTYDCCVSPFEDEIDDCIEVNFNGILKFEANKLTDFPNVYVAAGGMIKYETKKVKEESIKSTPAIKDDRERLQSKQILNYSFYSKKLNAEYLIRHSELFDIDRINMLFDEN